ncbi:MAG: Na+/H+ antiporter NhaC, partial [Planctomycetota bacterium]
MRSRKIRGTRWFCIVWTLALLLGQTAIAQEADGFRAEFGDGVAPVREAPCTLVISALDARGEVLASFDWTAESISLAGVQMPHGERIVRIPGRSEPLSGQRYELADGQLTRTFDPSVSGAMGKSFYEARNGVLTLTNIVLAGDVVVTQGDAHFSIVEGTITPWAAIFPPLVAILLAIITRQVLIALFVGVWVGMWSILGGPFDGFLAAVTDLLPQALTESRVKILIFSCLLGSVVAMVARMGGSQALVALMTRYGKSPRGAQITTWCAGIFVFFDDYANALLVGNTMRPVTDRFRVSREKLSFLVDATSAPVACIFVISTWIAAEIGYIEGKLGTPAVQAASGLKSSGAYQVFLSTIPYNFYPILCLFFGLMVCLTGRDFGPMLRAERRARKEGKVLRDGAQPLSSKEMDDLEPVDPTRLRWYNAVVPIGSVVLCVVLTLYSTGADSVATAAAELSQEINFMIADGGVEVDIAEAKWRLAELENPPMRAIFGAADSYNALLLASALGVLVAGLMALGQRLMPLKEVVEVCTAGIKAMIPAALVLIMAWSLQGICERLNTSQFLVYH